MKVFTKNLTILIFYFSGMQNFFSVESSSTINDLISSVPNNNCSKEFLKAIEIYRNKSLTEIKKMLSEDYFAIGKTLKGSEKKGQNILYKLSQKYHLEKKSFFNLRFLILFYSNEQSGNYNILNFSDNCFFNFITNEKNLFKISELFSFINSLKIKIDISIEGYNYKIQILTNEFIKTNIKIEEQNNIINILINKFIKMLINKFIKMLINQFIDHQLIDDSLRQQKNNKNFIMSCLKVFFLNAHQVTM